MRDNYLGSQRDRIRAQVEKESAFAVAAIVVPTHQEIDVLVTRSRSLMHTRQKQGRRVDRFRIDSIFGTPRRRIAIARLINATIRSLRF